LVEILGALGLVAFAVSSICVGARCLVRGIRSRALPELSVGIGFLVGVLLGYLPETIATSTDLLSSNLSSAVLLGTQVAIRIAALAVMVFTIAVFHRDDALGLGLFLLVVLALVASWIAFPHFASHAESPRDRLWYEVFAVARSFAVAWGAAESLAYYRKSLRRVRIGLADPVVTDRFGLWGLGLAALAGLMASTTLAAVAGVDPTSFGWVLLESTLGLVGALCLWLAFFPPRAYLARFEDAEASAVG